MWEWLRGWKHVWNHIWKRLILQLKNKRFYDITTYSSYSACCHKTSQTPKAPSRVWRNLSPGQFSVMCIYAPFIQYIRKCLSHATLRAHDAFHSCLGYQSHFKISTSSHLPTQYHTEMLKWELRYYTSYCFWILFYQLRHARDDSTIVDATHCRFHYFWSYKLTKTNRLKIHIGLWQC